MYIFLHKCLIVVIAKFDLRVIVQGIIISVRGLLGVSVSGLNAWKGMGWYVLSAISSIGIHETSAS